MWRLTSRSTATAVRTPGLRTRRVPPCVPAVCVPPRAAVPCDAMHVMSERARASARRRGGGPRPAAAARPPRPRRCAAGVGKNKSSGATVCTWCIRHTMSPLLILLLAAATAPIVAPTVGGAPLQTDSIDGEVDQQLLLASSSASGSWAPHHVGPPPPSPGAPSDRVSAGGHVWRDWLPLRVASFTRLLISVLA
jgi:hypothetical protein